jgi:hypothetical protein
MVWFQMHIGLVRVMIPLVSYVLLISISESLLPNCNYSLLCMLAGTRTAGPQVLGRDSPVHKKRQREDDTGPEIPVTCYRL